jgi:hypothetical protein
MQPPRHRACEKKGKAGLESHEACALCPNVAAECCRAWSQVAWCVVWYGMVWARLVTCTHWRRRVSRIEEAAQFIILGRERRDGREDGMTSAGWWRADTARERENIGTGASR